MVALLITIPAVEVLAMNNAIVITRHFARKLFPDSLCLGLILCTCSAVSAQASDHTPEHLYEVSLLVVDQSDGERQKSLRDGLEKVLIRTSGQTDFSGSPEIQEALATPDVYLQQFGYVSLTELEKTDLKAGALNHPVSKISVTSKGITPKLPELTPTIRMNASFSPELIKALLRRAQLPVWPSNRPSVLVWLVADNGSGKHLVTQSDSSYSFLLQEAERRGLPVVLPMNDLNDQVILGANRLWDLDQAAITEASQRYGEDSILVGRIAQTSPGQWQGNWLYLLKGQSQLIDSSDEGLEDFVVHGISAAVQMQVLRYGISPSSTVHRIELEISGIDSLDHYANALLFLKNLDLVKSAVVTAVHDTTLYCALEIDGDSQLLQELIGLGHVLVSEDPAETATPVIPDTKATTEISPLRYRYSVQ